MTSSIQPTIRPTDRVAPQRPASPSPRPRPWLLPAALAAGMLCVAGAGFAAYQVMSGGDAPKPRLAAIKLGPVPEMPDLRNGVPALLPQRNAAAAVSQPVATSQPAIDDAQRKAMASTVAAANLRVAPPSAPTVRAESEAPKAMVRPVSASASVPAAEPAVVRSVEIKRPTETASLGDPRPPVASAPAPAPAPAAEASTPAASVPAPSTRVASLPTEAPLPPRRPALQPVEPVADRSVSTKPRPPVAAPRPAPQAQAAASPQPGPSAAPEDRSLLGIPVPRYVPSGRDIRDAAATVGNAVTSIPDLF